MVGPDTLILESCANTWLFDTERQRFRRVPRGDALQAPVPPSAWTEYFKLEIDPETDAFVVSLNPGGTRLLRSYTHTDPCPHCTEEATSELSLEAINDNQ